MPPTAPAELLRAKLKLKQLEARKKFAFLRPKAHKLLTQKGFGFKRLKENSVKLIAGTTLTGTLLLSPPGDARTTPRNKSINSESAAFSTINKTRAWISSRLASLPLPSPGHFSRDNEQRVSLYLRSAYGINATAEMEGNRLNHSFGYVGYEQHLKRYPGDSLHFHSGELQAGMAPGLGGWGYFAKSEGEMTEIDTEREKYYFAVQTLYLDNWDRDWRDLGSWYKYRKMVMINPENGKAVVGVVADAGPAWYTGKQFGASPEAMRALDLSEGKRKGKVVLFFVDDPENKVPLGPLEQNLSYPNIELA